MEPKIIERDEIKFVGCVSYGGDIHEIWNIFMKHKSSIKYANLDIGYEIHIFPNDYEKNKKCHVFVGVEVDKFEDLPVETFAKTIPSCKYAVFTHRLVDGGYSGSNEKMDKWLEKSKYKMAYPLSIQFYDERFKGGDQEDSEIDFYIPIKSK